MSDTSPAVRPPTYWWLAPPPQRGDRGVAYPEAPDRHRIFITITRVARDGSWVDVVLQTWAVRWTKRMPTETLRRFAVRRRWGWQDLVTQQADYEKWLRGRAP